MRAKSSMLKQRQCRLCHAPLTTTFVDLGMSPLCESYLSADQIDQMEPYFPLNDSPVCDGCFLVQLQEYVKPEHIFTEYAYFSSYSMSWVDHARRYCEMITDRLDLGPKSKVFEDSEQRWISASALPAVGCSRDRHRAGCQYR